MRANTSVRIAALVSMAAVFHYGAVLAATAKTKPQATSANPDDMHLVHVQGNVYMLADAVSNSTVQLGKDGVLLVDSPRPALAAKAMELIRGVADKPVRYIVSTHLNQEHMGGNEAMTKFGTLAVPAMSGSAFAQLPVAAVGSVSGVSILGHENVLNRLTAAGENAYPGVLITSTYFLPEKDFFMNGEAVVVYHVPEANTDGDSIVFFRRSDVLSVGDIFTPGRYPDIDVEKGGSIDGLLAGLNQILLLTVPEAYQDGGTMVVPGHGRLCDEADVVEYRDMVSIVRDRVEDMVKKKMTLAQVQAAKPTRDYDTEYGGVRGGPTPEQFVASMYTSLTKRAGATQ